jgi:hypothetical protein
MLLGKTVSVVQLVPQADPPVADGNRESVGVHTWSMKLA